MKETVIKVREYREKLLNDPYRPLYHFTVPEDNGFPGDPNGAFFADGIYHLMYLYRNSKTEAYHWGHIASKDLLHWWHLEDALTVKDNDNGCYSGGAFIDDDKCVYLTFWRFSGEDTPKDNRGIIIAYSKTPYLKWERIEPASVNETEWGIKDVMIDGKLVHLGCADPSNIWKMNGYYYMQSGNLCVLNSYGRKADSEQKYKGNWTELFRSADMKNWEYVHRFYEPMKNGTDLPDETEDGMCPSFLPLYDAKSGGRLTDKWLQLFISHNKGCQYYVGELKDEKFYPEIHGRMSWNDNTYFAPEALIDDKNRHIMWAWLNDNCNKEYEEFGWSGVYSFPRVVWLENNELHMAPAEELENLQYNMQEFKNIKNDKISVNNGELFRMKSVWKLNKSSEAGFKLRVSEDGKEYTKIYVDREKGKLVFDARVSGYGGNCIKEEAPFVLGEDENLHMDIFVDKSVIEVYVNDRQAICRRVYPKEPKTSMGVSILGELSELESLTVWEMAPANMY